MDISRIHKRKEDARRLDRPGYWACEDCSAHNLTHQIHCLVCGAKNWQLVELQKELHAD